jgi:hypothetical protein
MMLGEESASATYWKKCGDEALANDVQHVVMMVSLSVSVRFPYSLHNLRSIAHICISFRAHIGLPLATK